MKENLLNCQFGRLTVIAEADNIGSLTAWFCRCECGKEIVVRSQSLKRGATKSCGCYNNDLRLERNTTHGMCGTVEYLLYVGAKRRATRKGLPFNLTLEDIIVPEFCPVFPEIRLQRNPVIVGDNSPTLDKLDPALGYVRGNVHVISHRANTLKNAATAEELTRIVEWMREVRLEG